jgi:hypothetical protein
MLSLLHMARRAIPYNHHAHQLHNARRLPHHTVCVVRLRDEDRLLIGERRLPAGGARRPRREPAVDAPRVEPVVAGRQHAHPVPARELREADDALGPRRTGQVEPRKVGQARQRLHQRRPPRLLLPIPATAPVPRSRVLLPVFFVVAVRSPRDAERALEHDVEREGREEGTDEDREDGDGGAVEQGEGALGRVVGVRKRPCFRNGAGRRGTGRLHLQEACSGVVVEPRFHGRVEPIYLPELAEVAKR